jgi:hypothetical protein
MFVMRTHMKKSILRRFKIDTSLPMRESAVGNSAGFPQEMKDGPEGEDVAVSPESCDAPSHDVLQGGCPPERLATSRVAQVQFDRRHSGVYKRIPYRHARVSISARIDDEAVGFPPRFLEPAHDLALVIRLKEFHGDVLFAGGILHQPPDFRQGHPPIGFRLPNAENVEVRTVYEQDTGTARRSFHSISFARLAD